MDHWRVYACVVYETRTKVGFEDDPEYQAKLAKKRNEFEKRCHWLSDIYDKDGPAAAEDAVKAAIEAEDAKAKAAIEAAEATRRSKATANAKATAKAIATRRSTISSKAATNTDILSSKIRSKAAAKAA
nr:putative reverse transcriptase domain-containing protein [Tanacetum cinerariifolium]